MTLAAAYPWAVSERARQFRLSPPRQPPPWTNTTSGSGPAVVNVTTPGKHVFNIWMREDGTVIDRIILTTNSGYTPSGEGPAESPHGDSGSNTPPTVDDSSAATDEDIPGNGTVTGSDADGDSLAFSIAYHFVNYSR